MTCKYTELRAVSGQACKPENLTRLASISHTQKYFNITCHRLSAFTLFFPTTLRPSAALMLEEKLSGNPINLNSAVSRVFSSAFFTALLFAPAYKSNECARNTNRIASDSTRNPSSFKDEHSIGSEWIFQNRKLLALKFLLFELHRFVVHC